MTLYSGTNAVTATLAANTVDTVILTKPTKSITILSDSGSAAIFFTVCLVGGPDVTPTVNGVNCYTIPATIGSLNIPIISNGGVVVNLISSGTPQYTVEVF